MSLRLDGDVAKGGKLNPKWVLYMVGRIFLIFRLVIYACTFKRAAIMVNSLYGP